MTGIGSCFALSRRIYFPLYGERSKNDSTSALLLSFEVFSPQAASTFCTLSVLISGLGSYPASGSYLISSTLSFPICTMDIINSSQWNGGGGISSLWGKRLARCLAQGYGTAGGGAGIKPGEAEAQSPGSDPSGDMGFQAREYSFQNRWDRLAVRLHRRRSAQEGGGTADGSVLRAHLLPRNLRVCTCEPVFTPRNVCGALRLCLAPYGNKISASVVLRL